MMLKAYGTVEYYQYWSSDPIEWRPVWYRSESEANEVCDRSATKLAEARTALAEKRGEEARVQMEAESDKKRHVGRVTQVSSSLTG